MVELCNEPAPEQHLLTGRENTNDHPVDIRPPRPACVQLKDHPSPWHDAGYGIPRWTTTPLIVRTDQ